MPDPFQSHQTGLSSPATQAVAITKSDDDDLANAVRAIYVGGAGNVALIPVGQDDSVVFQGVQAGTWLPVRTKKVLATGTTATALVGLL